MILALCGAGIGSACARSPSASAAAAAPAPAPVTTLDVINQTPFDMDVYVSNDPATQRIRIGTAIADTTTKMVLPDTVMLAVKTPLIFYADPVGRIRTSTSRTIVVTRGDVVTVRIPRDSTATKPVAEVRQSVY